MMKSLVENAHIGHKNGRGRRAEKVRSHAKTFHPMFFGAEFSCQTTPTCAETSLYNSHPTGRFLIAHLSSDILRVRLVLPAPGRGGGDGGGTGGLRRRRLPQEMQRSSSSETNDDDDVAAGVDRRKGRLTSFATAANEPPQALRKRTRSPYAIDFIDALYAFIIYS